MNWTDVTLGQFNQIKDFLLDAENTEEDRILYEIQVLFNINPYKIKVDELKKYINELKFLSQPLPRMKVVDKYRLGDTTYILKKNLQDFTVAQWIDYQTFLRDGGSETDNYQNILSVFFFPEGSKEYNEGYDINKVRKDINDNLSIADAMSIAAFFLKCHKALLIRFLLYTRKKTLKAPLKIKERMKIRREYRRAIIRILLTGVSPL